MDVAWRGSLATRARLRPSQGRPRVFGPQTALTRTAAGGPVRSGMRAARWRHRSSKPWPILGGLARPAIGEVGTGTSVPVRGPLFLRSVLGREPSVHSGAPASVGARSGGPQPRLLVACRANPFSGDTGWDRERVSFERRRRSLAPPRSFGLAALCLNVLGRWGRRCVDRGRPRSASEPMSKCLGVARVQDPAASWLPVTPLSNGRMSGDAAPGR